ncbi:telomere-length maintenance and DNA damage repair-domain-containing protein [Fimicolochytrium jonesii]|uniref:telomere-length maintenance and DNA damage repair-domain-containing protein n=1 Tax=Fimicolochytrium jonesii TaxID=1396493 RepID=UPI0022FE0944|nr:telomere-length maintenance and DNA damage repair-domain-containing protein [Fimicolochytrium jonesii]KAI8822888.1 telomere-length maintenance and DNA damage repair-domain-containing protein [Fimicolochytrium jonesii]
MTVQLSLRKVLAKFLSDNKKDAQSGLQELRTILSDDRNLSQIDGKDWRSILEAFERAVENLKAAAANGRTTNAKASATSTVARLEKQLGECASEFRWTIERAGSNLGPALNKPVLEHILTILPYRDGLYQPIAVHYTRALRTLLAQRAYREHIPISRWHGLLKLCMRCLTAEVQSEDRRGGRRSMTLELVELSKVFYYLVIGCPDDLAAYSEDLLEFLARFIEHHPGETTCHGPLITAANHILFETAHQNLHAAQNFLESTVPFLIPLWENRSGPLRNQLILTLRFYLHIYDPTGKFAFDVKRWEANCLRLYDGIQQEFGSKFGVSPVDDLHHFVTVLRLKQKTGVLIPDTLNGHLDPASVTKWYPTYSFLDLGADVYGALLYMEANPPTHPSSDTPRARKRVKRSDVVADLTNLKKKLGNSRQKLGVLQILAFLALQTPHMLSPAQLQHLMTDFFADLMASESDVQNWALVCSTPLWSHPAAITPTFAKMAWDNTTRVVSSPSLLVDMGYHVLEAVLRAGFVPRGDVAAVVAEVGRGMRWGVSVPSAAALEFLLMSKRARGSEAMCQTLSVIDDFADSICEWVVRGRAAVPIDMIIDVLLGTPHGNTQRTDADDFPPLDLPPRDEFIGEWRLGNSRRVCRAIVEEDWRGIW